MKTFCASLIEHVMKMVNFKKKKVINKTAGKIIWQCKNLLYCKEKFENTYLKDKKYCNICSIRNLKCSIPKKIPIVIHNGSTYDYHIRVTQRI